MQSGSLHFNFDESSRTLVLTGEVDDTSISALRAEIHAATGGFSRPLVVDLSEVTYLPSSGIGVLASVLDESAEAGQPVELVAARGTIAQRVLEVSAVPHRRR